MKKEYFLLLSNFINSNKLFLEKLLTEDGFIEEEFNKVLSFINNIGYQELILEICNINGIYFCVV